MPLGAAPGTSQQEVELPVGLGGVTSYQILTNSECLLTAPGVRAWVLRSKSERERTQTNS